MKNRIAVQAIAQLGCVRGLSRAGRENSSFAAIPAKFTAMPGSSKLRERKLWKCPLSFKRLQPGSKALAKVFDGYDSISSRK
jgi:hypothetical protein